MPGILRRATTKTGRLACGLSTGLAASTPRHLSSCSFYLIFVGAQIALLPRDVRLARKWARARFFPPHQGSQRYSSALYRQDFQTHRLVASGGGKRKCRIPFEYISSRMFLPLTLVVCESFEGTMTTVTQKFVVFSEK